MRMDLEGDEYCEVGATAALCRVFFGYMFPQELRDFMEPDHHLNHLMETTGLFMQDILWSSDSFQEKVQKLCALSKQWIDDCTEEDICLRTWMTPQSTHSTAAYERLVL